MALVPTQKAIAECRRLLRREGVKNKGKQKRIMKEQLKELNRRFT